MDWWEGGGWVGRYIPSRISNTAVSCFEKWAVSLSVFNPSLCLLSSFHLVSCRCSKAMSLVEYFTLNGPR